MHICPKARGIFGVDQQKVQCEETFGNECDLGLTSQWNTS